MKCQNCGKNEVTFRYTQIINGVKKELSLCDKCAQELGLKSIDFSMPISVSSFFGDMLNEYAADAFLPTFGGNAITKCNNCGMSYNEFIENGEFGCANCYDVFSDRIDSLLKNIHGSARHIGRVSNNIETNNINLKNKNKSTDKTKNEIKQESKKEQIERLQTELNKAVKEERYEDAAKIRDEIKKINN